MDIYFTHSCHITGVVKGVAIIYGGELPVTAFVNAVYDLFVDADCVHCTGPCVVNSTPVVAVATAVTGTILIFVEASVAKQWGAANKTDVLIFVVQVEFD